MKMPAEFDEIRPYSPEELPQVFEELIADPNFRAVTESIIPDVPFEMLAQKIRQCKTNLDFQKTFFYGLLWKNVKEHADGMDIDCCSITDRSVSYTFISNHRDIILDSAFLSVLLIDNNIDTVEIAIGDNLLIYPWIKKIVRVNKSFIVKRGLSIRQKLEASTLMSRYMHFAINQKHENIWIAQRQGRAKDSDDRTQESVLKMMTMGGEGTISERLMDLNIMPLSISYEYDPCDYLKAKEMQQKRDNPDYVKSPDDDLLNMKTGLFGYKGKIHFHTAPCVNSFIKNIDPSVSKNEIFTIIAEKIDKDIHSNYCIFAGNYIAYDLLKGGKIFEDKYSSQEKENFLSYIDAQIAKVDLSEKDYDFLKEKMLIMYANPLINHLVAIE